MSAISSFRAGAILKVALLVLLGVFVAFLSWRDAAVLYHSELASIAPPSAIREHPLFARNRQDQDWDPAKGFTGDKAEARDAAISALQLRPVDSVSLRLASVQFQETNATRLDLLNASQEMSRRDLRTQLALLNAAAQRQDVEAALGHLDTALLVRPQAGVGIFPLLIPVLSDEKARESLAPYSNRSWFSEFLMQAVATAPNPVDVATFVTEEGVDLSTFEEGTLKSLVRRLAANGDVPQAYSLAEQMGYDRDKLRAFGFTDAIDEPEIAPLVWELESGVDGRAGLSGSGDLEVTIFPGRRLLAAQRSTAMAPGTYNAAQEFHLAEGREPIVDFRMRCLMDGRWRVQWRNVFRVRSEAAPAVHSIMIPEGCSVQSWQIWIQASDSPTQSTVFVSQSIART